MARIGFTKIRGSNSISALKQNMLDMVHDIMKEIEQDGIKGEPEVIGFDMSIFWEGEAPEIELPVVEGEEDVRVEKNKRNKGGRAKSTDGELREGGEEESSK